jgi:rRNA processing protein Krr1/Pno1
MSYQRTLRIQKERIGAIIGKKGLIKDEIEKKCKIDIQVDSEYGDVVLKSKTTDPLDILNINKGLEVILAISKGFSPEKAFNLFTEENTLEIIDLREFVETVQIPRKPTNWRKRKIEENYRGIDRFLYFNIWSLCRDNRHVRTNNFNNRGNNTDLFRSIP